MQVRLSKTKSLLFYSKNVWNVISVTIISSSKWIVICGDGNDIYSNMMQHVFLLLGIVSRPLTGRKKKKSRREGQRHANLFWLILFIFFEYTFNKCLNKQHNIRVDEESFII